MLPALVLPPLHAADRFSPTASIAFARSHSALHPAVYFLAGRLAPAWRFRCAGWPERAAVPTGSPARTRRIHGCPDHWSVHSRRRHCHPRPIVHNRRRHCGLQPISLGAFEIDSFAALAEAGRICSSGTLSRRSIHYLICIFHLRSLAFPLWHFHLDFPLHFGICTVTSAQSHLHINIALYNQQSAPVPSDRYFAGQVAFDADCGRGIDRTPRTLISGEICGRRPRLRRGAVVYIRADTIVIYAQHNCIRGGRPRTRLGQGSSEPHRPHNVLGPLQPARACVIPATRLSAIHHRQVDRRNTRIIAAADHCTIIACDPRQASPAQSSPFRTGPLA